MPLPFADFPASSATVDLASGTISYEAAGELAASGSVLGEALAASEVAAAAVVLAEPLLIVGAGLAAAAAAEAILNKIAPNSPKPQFRSNRASAGRIGGNFIVEYKHKIQGQPEATDTFAGQGQYQGTQRVKDANNIVTWGFVVGGAFFGAFSAAESLIEEPLIVTNITQTGGQPGTEKQPASDWVNPGTGNLPVPTPVDIAYPDGQTVTITPTVYPSPKGDPAIAPQTPISPGVTVHVPEVGVTFNFTPINVTVTFTTPSDSQTVFAPPRSTQTVYKLPSNPCDCPPSDTSKLICKIDELQHELLNSGYTYTATLVPEDVGGTVEIIGDEPYSVSFNITQIPSTARSETGLGVSPDVLFSGWFSARINGVDGERIPIHYENTTFSLAPNVTGYSYCFYVGFRGTSTYRQRKPKPFVSKC